MARRAMHVRLQYVGENLLRFVILGVVAVLALASVILFLRDPARGALAGAIVVLAAWVAWKMTDQATYREAADQQDK